MKFIKILFYLVIVLIAGYFAAIFYFHSRDPLVKWDWKKINTDKVCYPKDFLWGTATAAYQVEGGFHNNNWTWWEKQTRADGRPAILNHDTCGRADDDWNLYPLDIKLMKKLGVNSYRFSVAWSKIMPTPDSINIMALKHYQELCDTLLANGIEPIITLFHFTYPFWFQQIGGFEKTENIKYFVQFSRIVYKALGGRVKYWVTINEPVVLVYSAYFIGEYPPGKQDPKLTAVVLANLLKAHQAVYNAIKQMPGGQEAKIGIVKNIMQMDPYRRYNLLDNLIAYFADLNFNQSLLSAFSTGKFHFYMPGMVNKKMLLPDLPQTLDFIGLNYYSHNAFRFVGDLDKSLTALPYPGEPLTDMGYTVYPEGLYRAIKRIAKLHKPIIITENGIADSLDTQRYDFIKRSLYALSKAISEGYDVRGYFYWSLLDNFEWNLGYSQRFGLYKVNFKTEKRTLRKGAKAFVETIDKWQRECFR